MVLRKKYSNFEIGKLSFGINCVIVFIGALIFGLPKALYTLISMFVQGTLVDRVINGFNSKKLLLILNHRLTNIRHDHLHHITSEIVKREPSFICIEDLNVKGMMKNRHLSKAVQQQGFYEFRRQMEYKSEWNNIQVIIADQFFPSSKLCSCCGKIKKDLKLSERIYKCECGNVVDRDLQAALNLKKYGEDVLKRSVA